MAQLSLILKNGQIVDGSGAPRYGSDLGIADDRIAVISKVGGIEGDLVIDCRGLVVAPGFIDTHSHSDLRILSEPELPMKLRQGITLEVFGQDGISVAPTRPDHRKQTADQLAGLLGRTVEPWEWTTVAEYLGAVERVKPAIDCSYLVPHGAIRTWVVGASDRPASADELRDMSALLEKSMHEGAWGLSTGLIYPPCCYANTGELIELCKTVARLDGVFVVHMRSESDYLEEAVLEMIEVSRQSGARLHISHFKAAGRENWSSIDAALELINQALREGLTITADQYPYIAGSTMLGAILPPWAHDGGVDATINRLRDPESRQKMRAHMESKDRARWDNFWKWSGPEGIILSDIPSGHHADLLGKNLAQAAQIRSQDPVELAFDLLLQERLGVSMISFSQSEEVLRKILRQSYVNICTDGLLGGRPHPRAYGTFPRVLSKYCREDHVIPLEEAIRKMTSQAAAAMHIDGIGRIAEGYRANLVVFDETSVLDRATFEEPSQFPTGIHHVIVGGRPAILGGERTSEFAGSVLRKDFGSLRQTWGVIRQFVF